MKRRPGARPDRAVAGSSDKGGLQLRMQEHFTGFSPLAFPDPQGRLVGVQAQVAGLQRQGLGYAESGPPFPRVSSLAWGLGAAAIRALTSWASRYSGSVEPLPPGDCCKSALLVFTSRGRRLRGRVVVMARSVTKGPILLHAVGL